LGKLLRATSIIIGLLAVLLAMPVAGGGALASQVTVADNEGWGTAGGNYQRDGQSNASTSNNYGGQVWAFDSRENSITIQDDWFFRRPLIVDGTDTVIFEDGGTLYAVRDGNLAWQYHVADPDSPINDAISPPAMGNNGTIYVGGHDKYLHALDRDGHLLWKYYAGNWIDTTPAVGSDGTIYIATSTNSWDENETLHYYLHAVAPNGTLVWKVETGPCEFSSVALAPDGTIYIVSGSRFVKWNSSAQYLYAVEPSGMVRWICPLGNMTFLSPAVSSNGTVYMLTDYDRDPEGGPFLMAIGPDGIIIWKDDLRSISPGYDGLYATPPVIAYDGSIYFSYGWGVCAVDPDGSFKWRFEVNNGLISNLAISREGTIFFGTMGREESDLGNQGYIYALNPDGTLDWKVRFPGYPHSNMAIGNDGTLYIAANGNVFALNGGISPEGRTLLTVGIVGAVIAVLATLAVMIIKNKRRREGRSDL
jgi:outer membrane protein assembly factor BamB